MTFPRFDFPQLIDFVELGPDGPLNKAVMAQGGHRNWPETHEHAIPRQRIGSVSPPESPMNLQNPINLQCILAVDLSRVNRPLRFAARRTSLPDGASTWLVGRGRSARKVVEGGSGAVEIETRSTLLAAETRLLDGRWISRTLPLPTASGLFRGHFDQGMTADPGGVAAISRGSSPPPADDTPGRQFAFVVSIPEGSQQR